MRLSPEKKALTGLLSNIAYGLFHGTLGIMGRDWWFLTLAAYYITLSVMRFAVLQCSKSSLPEPFLRRFIGGLFLFLSLTLVGSACLSFLFGKGTKHHEIVMITIALYAFTKLVTAIIALARSRREGSLIPLLLRNISFADALVSIFSLQRSMLVTFEGMQQQNIQLMNALTGTTVYVSVFLLGLNLIGGKKIIMAKSKLVKANEKIAETVVDGYKKIETGVVDGYKKIETGVVSGFQKIEDKFVGQFLTKDGETVEEAKERLKQK